MIYHKKIKIIKRSEGKSAVAAGAYRAGETITDERSNITHDYGRKGGVVHSEIMAPAHAPDWVYDRSALWNAVEKREPRKDSQLAREFEFGLQNEFDLETNVKLVRQHLAPMVESGMIIDFNVHDDPRKEPRNPHCHALITMRDISSEGFLDKNRSWNPDFRKSRKGKDKGKSFVADKGPLMDLRAKWAQIVNAELERQGVEGRVDHRSYKDQGSKKIAQPKVGIRAVKWGDESRLVEQRRLVQQHNHLVDQEEILRSRLARVRPTLKPSTSTQKQAYKKRLIEDHYKASVSPDLVPLIKFAIFPGDPDPLISLYSGCWVKDQGNKITAHHTDAAAVALMFDLAEAKGWASVDISGDPDYVTLALAEAQRRGLTVGKVRQLGGGPIRRPVAEPQDDQDEENGLKM